jgi:hypothetical protein
MVSLIITHDDGSTDTINQTLGWTRTRELGAMRRARIDVERSAAEAANLQPKQDTVALGSIDTLRLVDLETGGSTWTLVCYSFEWDANRVAPTAGGDLRSGTDDSLVSGLVSEVSSWTAGTINSFTGPMEFVMNHAHRHEALRRIERNVPGELQWRDEGTVDYVDRLGSDRTGTVTISAAEGNVEGEVSITKRGRELDGTHFRILGAHEGEAQISANLVPSDDSATYENRVNYTTSRWSDGDPRDWDRVTNKDVADQDTIEEEAATFGEELTDPLVEAEATVYGEDLKVGDTVRVVKQDADLDRDMRVHRIKTVSEAAKRVYKCLFSTRTTVRKGDSHDLEDIQRFNTAFQGSSVTINAGPLEKAIDSGDPVFVPFRYPEVEYENNAELQVRGLEYRIDSQGAAAGGDHFHSVEVEHPAHDHDVPINVTSADNSDLFNVVTDANLSSTLPADGTFQSIAAISPTDHTSWTGVGVTIENQSSNRIEVASRLENQDTFFQFPNSTGVVDEIEPDGVTYAFLIDATDTYQEDLELQVKADDGATVQVSATFFGVGRHNHAVAETETSDTALGTTVSETSDASGDHIHPPDPGIYETNDTPSNVNVYANGTQIASNIGSGEFETVVDVTGEFTPGEWNFIELTSDSLGIVSATIFIEGYKQIGKQS